MNKPDEIDIEQMRADFATLPDPGLNGAMARARKLVEWHIKNIGPIPKAESLIDEIASEIAVVQLLAVRPRDDLR